MDWEEKGEETTNSRISWWTERFSYCTGGGVMAVLTSRRLLQITAHSGLQHSQLPLGGDNKTAIPCVAAFLLEQVANAIDQACTSG